MTNAIIYISFITIELLIFTKLVYNYSANPWSFILAVIYHKAHLSYLLANKSQLS